MLDLYLNGKKITQRLNQLVFRKLNVNRFKFVSKWEVFKEWASNNSLILMLRRCVAYGLQFLLRA